MFEGTKVQNSAYFKFSVKADRTEIWKGIMAYQMKFHKTPEYAWYNPTDKKIGELLRATTLPHVEVGDSIEIAVPEGQVWFYVPGGYAEVVG